MRGNKIVSSLEEIEDSLRYLSTSIFESEDNNKILNEIDCYNELYPFNEKLETVLGKFINWSNYIKQEIRREDIVDILTLQDSILLSSVGYDFEKRLNRDCDFELKNDKFTALFVFKYRDSRIDSHSYDVVINIKLGSYGSVVYTTSLRAHRSTYYKDVADVLKKALAHHEQMKLDAKYSRLGKLCLEKSVFLEASVKNYGGRSTYALSLLPSIELIKDGKSIHYDIKGLVTKAREALKNV